MSLPVTALTAIICALLILLTAIGTVRERVKSNVSFGFAKDNPKLEAMARSHANLTEHAPVFLIMLVLLELARANHLGLMILSLLFLVVRISHIIGMNMSHASGKTPILRVIGVLGTWLSYGLAIGWSAYMIITGNL